MTTHLDDELLAQWVIAGEIPDDAATDHLRLCTRCSEALAELRAVAGNLDDLPRLERAPAEVWGRITGELGFEPAGTHAAPAPLSIDEPAQLPVDEPAQPDRSTSRRALSPTTLPTTPGTTRPAGPPPTRPTRRVLAIAASVAAVLGLGAGIGGTLLVTSDDSQQPAAEAVVKLEPLTGKSGAGNADLVRGTSGSQLRITASGLTKTPGFYEVWLINEDGKRMVSLGVLDPSTGGTFQVPASLTGQGYRIVDISLEPDDGNPEHSHDSVVRGTLPG